MVNEQEFQQSQQFKEFTSAVELGLVPGYTTDVKFGYAPIIAAMADVWPEATDYVFPVDAGQAIEAVSDNLADVFELHILGLDANGLEQDVMVTLNGTTPVAVPGTWRAINRAHNDNGTAFLGKISIQGTGAPNANVFAVILAVDQQTTQTPFMVPANKIALVNNFSSSINKASGSDVAVLMRLLIRRDGKVTRTQIRYGLQRNGTSNLSSDLIVPIPVAPLSQIRVTADPSASTDVSAEFSMWLVDKDLVPAAVLAAIIEG